MHPRSCDRKKGCVSKLFKLFCKSFCIEKGNIKRIAVSDNNISFSVESVSMTDTIDVLLSEEVIDARIRELAAQIDADYAGESITLLCTLKGAVFFACELAKRITIPVFMDFIQTASYEGTQSTGTVSMKLDVPDEAIEGKHIIIIEDVIDTGRTLSVVKEMMLKRKPASLKVCSLLDKHECRVVPFDGDYIGFTIGNDFVVGYGLDVDQKYRNLPFVGIVK